MPYQLSPVAMSHPHQSPMPMKHMSGDNTHSSSASSATRRRSDIKSNSHSQTKAQWKEHLRKGCLERAKLARRDRLRKSRRPNDAISDNGGNNNNDNDGASSLVVGNGSDTSSSVLTSKRARDEMPHNGWNARHFGCDTMVDHTPWSNNLGNKFGASNNSYDVRESGDSDADVVDTARSLVEQELQRAMTGVQHCHQVCPVDGGIPCKRKVLHGNGAIVREQQHQLESMASELSDYGEKDESRQREGEDEYKMSHEEFEELLNVVTEELQREDELLEEELWELERAEAMERERLMHQIDDFEAWEELEQHQEQHNSQPNTYISPLANLSSPVVTCPICNSASLMETPHDGIRCANNNAATTTGMPNSSCTFQLDVSHEGLTLNNLQSQLQAVYDEHSQVCSRGVLKFRVEDSMGISMLMAKCDTCSSDVVVL